MFMDVCQYWQYDPCKNFFKDYVKSHYRAALTDEHLQSILMIKNNNSKPQLSETLSNPPKSIPSFLLADLHYKKIILNYFYFKFCQ